MDSIGKYTYVPAGTATTVVSTVACTLIGIVINTKGASSNLLTIYDNTAGSGTVVGVIDTTVATGFLRYGCILKTGCTVKSTTGTGADLTIITT